MRVGRNLTLRFSKSLEERKPVMGMTRSAKREYLLGHISGHRAQVPHEEHEVKWAVDHLIKTPAVTTDKINDICILIRAAFLNGVKQGEMNNEN